MSHRDDAENDQTNKKNKNKSSNNETSFEERIHANLFIRSPNNFFKLFIDKRNLLISGSRGEALSPLDESTNTTHSKDEVIEVGKIVDTSFPIPDVIIETSLWYWLSVLLVVGRFEEFADSDALPSEMVFNSNGKYRHDVTSLWLG